MDEFFWLGSAIGAVIGIAHGVNLYRQMAARAPAGRATSGKAQALYYALWTLLLWTVFGAYALLFWILGILAYPIVRLIRRPRTAS